MSESVLLVCLPPNPLRFSALRPRHDAAVAAASLRAQGIHVSIADFGTLERLSRFITPAVLRQQAEIVDAGPAMRPLDFSARLTAADYVNTAAQMTHRYIIERVPSAVVFLTLSPFESRAARVIAGQLNGIPAQIVLDGKLQTGSHPSGPVAEALMQVGAGIAAFDPDVYPALAKETKLRVFEIGTDTTTADSVSGLFTILEETAILNRQYGARAFHFARSVAGNQLYHLASELVTRNSRFRYSVSASMTDLPWETATLAAASGCVAASFLVGSGSQRLIDNYFAYPFNLHGAERTIAAFARAGVHASVELTYPCAQDDFHTRDETVRFIGRCLPHAVRVHSSNDSSAPASAVWKPAERRRRSLERTLEALGTRTNAAPSDALVASLAGFAGRDLQFENYALRALATGNFDALAGLVESINAAASGRDDTFYWKALGADQRMVGN